MTTFSPLFHSTVDVKFLNHDGSFDASEVYVRDRPVLDSPIKKQGYEEEGIICPLPSSVLADVHYTDIARSLAADLAQTESLLKVTEKAKGGDSKDLGDNVNVQVECGE